MAEAIKETEIASAVITWLKEQHWEIYQEVQFHGYGGVADIVAVRKGILWIIECKTSYGFAVLEQATRWPAHYRSVAVPASKEPRDYRVVVNYYHVGVIEVSPPHLPSMGHHVHEKISPPIFIRHHKTAKDMLGDLTELHKTFAPAGSRGGYHLTPYKQTMIEVEKVVAESPGCTIKHVHEILGKMHYSSKSSFMGSIVHCLQDFEKEWCIVDTTAIPYKLYAISKAYREGREAKVAGKSRATNPYPNNSLSKLPNFHNWNDGWDGKKYNRKQDFSKRRKA